jgi:hypothetical protein
MAAFCIVAVAGCTTYGAKKDTMSKSDTMKKKKMAGKHDTMKKKKMVGKDAKMMKKEMKK